MKLVISKFGGTSMGDASCMLRSAEIVLTQGARVVVVSATSGTTNKLLALGSCSEKGDELGAQSHLRDLIEKHTKIASDLSLNNTRKKWMDDLFKELISLQQGILLLRECSAKALDALVSLGERLSSILFTQALEVCLQKAFSSMSAQWMDVREVMITDEQFGKARPQISDIHAKAQAQWLPLLKDHILVTQGFIGRTKEGATTTLGRGGSDYSAALIAEALHADVLEIWTDVPGIATTDPRIVPQAQVIAKISFDEASEMASFGAKVLHPATLLPAIRRNIPVYVASSFEPGRGGTWVQDHITETPLIRAFALKKSQSLVTLSNPEMLYAHGFLFKVFEIFNRFKISIDTITTSQISVSMTLDDATLLNNQDLLHQLSQVAKVEVEEGWALVSLIGNQMNYTPGLAQKVFESIADINVRMIGLGASRHHFCFLVKDDKAHEVIQRLHRIFVQK